jgi:hypothetical protein
MAFERGLVRMTRTFYQMSGIPPSVMMRGKFFEIPSPFARHTSTCESTSLGEGVVQDRTQFRDLPLRNLGRQHGLRSVKRPAPLV